MFEPLRLTAGAMVCIDTCVRDAGRLECMGLLASPFGCRDVTAAVRLSARASPSSAEADPRAIHEAAMALQRRDLLLRGIWHSHGHLDVYHSGTDHTTINRLLPAMAAANFTRDVPVPVPAVRGPDRAVLPLRDGRLMAVGLRGRSVPGTDLHEAARWERIATEYVDDAGEPAVALTASHVRLSAGGVALHLRVPDGAAVETRIDDVSACRVARLYSLVVNARGDRCACCLVVVEIGDGCLPQIGDCPVIVTPGGSDTAAIEMDAFAPASAGNGPA